MTTEETVQATAAPTPSVRRKGSFSGDVLKLVTGTTFAQLLTILASPILTRLYAPEAFGTVAIFTSLTSIVGVIVCLRYELAILLPEKDEEAVNLLGVSLSFSVLVSLLTVLAVWWGQGLLLSWLNAPTLGPYLWLAPPMVFASGVFLALNYWNSRTRHFGRLSVVRVISSLSTTAMTLGAGFGGYATAGAMIGANVAGQTIATGVLGTQIWRDNQRLFLRSINWQGMLDGLKFYRRFPLYSTWAALINTISWQLPALLLTAFFSPTVVGYYALGFRVLQLPMNLIGSAIGQVFFQRAAQAKTDGTLTGLVEAVFRTLVRISVVPILLLTFLGRDLFIVVFGPEWAEAGIYAQILSIWVIFWFVASPLSTVLIVLQRQDIEFRLSSMSFLLRLGALTIGGLLLNAQLAIGLFSLAGIVVYGYLCFLVNGMVGIPWQRTTWTIVQEVLIFLPFGIVLIILMLVVDVVWVGFVFAALVLTWHFVRLLSDKEFKTFLRAGSPV